MRSRWQEAEEEVRKRQSGETTTCTSHNSLHLHITCGQFLHVHVHCTLAVNTHVRAQSGMYVQDMQGEVAFT